MALRVLLPCDIQDLNIGWCSEVTDAGMESLSQLVSIRNLTISFCKNITDASLTFVATYSLLQSLNAYNCPLISNAAFESLGRVKWSVWISW